MPPRRSSISSPHPLRRQSSAKRVWSRLEAAFRSDTTLNHSTRTPAKSIAFFIFAVSALTNRARVLRLTAQSITVSASPVSVPFPDLLADHDTTFRRVINDLAIFPATGVSARRRSRPVPPAARFNPLA
jgi:hypothetical protein